MTVKEMEKMMAYLDKYFMQEDCLVLNMNNDGMEMYVEVLMYEPTETYPFWKLVTMGASDYRMPQKAQTKIRRNEYMLFVDKSVDLMVPRTLQWYYLKLLKIANHPPFRELNLTANDCVEWGEEEMSDVEGAYLARPNLVNGGKGNIYHPRLFKKIALLQVVLATRADLNSMPAKAQKIFPPERRVPHFLVENPSSKQSEN